MVEAYLIGCNSFIVTLLVVLKIGRPILVSKISVEALSSSDKGLDPSLSLLVSLYKT